MLLVQGRKRETLLSSSKHIAAISQLAMYVYVAISESSSGRLIFNTGYSVSDNLHKGWNWLFPSGWKAAQWQCWLTADWAWFSVCPGGQEEQWHPGLYQE